MIRSLLSLLAIGVLSCDASLVRRLLQGPPQLGGGAAGGAVIPGAGASAGAGAGIGGSALARKTKTVAVGVARHSETIADGLDALRHVGGREMAAIAGAVVAARYRRVPILLDGFVATAAAAALEATRPGALDHCQAAHVSAEPGHRRLLNKIDKAPLLDLGMRLGEASGAVLAVAVLRAAAHCHAGMATFEEAGVSGKDGG